MPKPEDSDDQLPWRSYEFMSEYFETDIAERAEWYREVERSRFFAFGNYCLPRMMRAARRFLGKEDAEEKLNDCFTWSRDFPKDLTHTTPEEHEGYWAGRAAILAERERYNSSRRRRSTEVHGNDLEAYADSNDSFAKLLSDMEQQAIFTSLLTELTAQEKTLVNAILVEMAQSPSENLNLLFRRVGDRLGISVSATGARFYRLCSKYIRRGRI